jgi:hypothetical protein
MLGARVPCPAPATHSALSTHPQKASQLRTGGCGAVDMVACLRHGVVVVAMVGLGNGVQAEYGEWMGDEAPPSSDLITHHVRNAVLDGANVTAAQGSFEGPAVLQALFSTSSWAALTGIHLAVGVSHWGGSVQPTPSHHNCEPLTLVPLNTGDYTRGEW